MKRKYAVLALVMLVLLAACENPFVNSILPDNTGNGVIPVKPDVPFEPDGPDFTINIKMTGKEGNDNVTASPASGKAGEKITLHYTLANTKFNNQLVFSGTQTTIAQENSPTLVPGTRVYTINKTDAIGDVITINAAFSHTDKKPNTIAFTDSRPVTKAYGDDPFTQSIANTGWGTGTISYLSSDTTAATVNASSGLVTIVAPGNTTITVTRAEDATYAAATASYILTVNKATGRTVTTPTATSVTVNSITVNAVTLSTPAYGQTVEYAIATSSVPGSNWQDGTAFSGLNPNTTYYVFARSKENANCNAGTAQVSAAIKTLINITITMTGNGTGDSVSPSSVTGKTGDTITINYTLASTAANNRLTFSGTTPAIERVDSAGTGTRTYTVKGEDAAEGGGISINAIFTHSAKLINTIAFADNSNVTKTYGDTAFTKAITNSGSGTGAISYVSSDTSAATVNASSGAVTILKAGTTTITATKAEDANYAAATALYTLTVDKKSVTITGPSVSNKTYDGNATAIVTGTATLNGKVGTDDVTVIAGTASFANKTVGNNKTVTFSGYSLGGAAKDNYTLSAQPASVTANITALRLTIGNPTVTSSKPYDGGTATTVTAGALTNKIGSDIVTVSATANFASANANTSPNMITVVYTISGTDAANYTKPVDYTTAGSITKAAGSAITGTPASASVTPTSIIMTAVTLTTATGQIAEYARSSTSSPEPASGWQDGTTFSGLTAETNYYIFARSKANDNYNTGTAKVSAVIKTPAAGTDDPTRQTVVNFEDKAIDAAYQFTEGDNPPTVKVVADPLHAGQKSLQITTKDGGSNKGYNQAAIVPINLPYALENYKSFSFRFNLVSGNTGTNLSDKPIFVYVAKNTTAFKKWGFGNDSGSNAFMDYLLGKTTATTFDSSYVGKWTSYTITITNPGSTIKDLQGNIFVAIGINCENNAVYMFDDLTFTLKDSYNPPPPPTPPPTTPLSPPSTGAVDSGRYRNMLKELGKTDAEITAKVTSMWNRMFVNGTTDQKLYIESSSDMAYIYTADTDDVRSEGMSYGMMACVQMGDQTRFDKLWKWSYTYMYNDRTKSAGSNSRGYFSWQCNTNGNKKDQGPAPDGEFYFVTSLLFAHARWGSTSGIFDYAQKAREILYDMCHRDPGGLDQWDNAAMFRRAGDVRSPGADDIAGYGMVVFSPNGASARHTDPSYHLPAFYEVWAIELEKDWNNGSNSKLYGVWSSAADLKADVDFYKDAAEKSRAFFPKTVHATTGLGPDYALWSGAGTGGNHADFEYDAWRIVMNAAMDYHWWAKDSWQKTYADRIQSFFESKGVNSYGSKWELNGTNKNNTDHSPGLVACNAVASLAATDKRAWLFLDDFWETTPTTGKYRYYDGSLYMLGLLHVSGNFKAYLSSGAGGGANSSTISPTTATFDKKTTSADYKDIAVTMTLNGNTLTSIKNVNTTLTSGTNYTIGGSGNSVVTIKKEYLTTLTVGTTTLTFTFNQGSTRSIAITINDTTNSSITPTTATFNKFAGQQQDVVVTMTLNGNTLLNIKNGSTNLTSGTNYTIGGSGNSVVTIKSSYLATLAVGTTTLTFDFNVGTDPTIAITIKDVAGGGNAIDFTTSPTVTVEVNNSTLISTTQTTSGGENVLQITTTDSNKGQVFGMALDFGTGGYNYIDIEMKAVSGDYNYKTFKAQIPKSPATTFSDSNNNTDISTGKSVMSTAWVTYRLDLNAAGKALTGSQKVGFTMGMHGVVVYQIRKIELVK